MANTKQLLSDAMQKFTSASPAPSEDSVDAFNKFRVAVRQAASKRTDGETLESLLGDLEPKRPVLRQLIDLCEKKKLYRKQIQAVFVEIVKVDSWLNALRNDASLTDTLPDILSEIYEQEKDRPVAEPPKAAKTTPVRPEEPAVSEGPTSQAPPPVVAAAESRTVDSVPEDVSRPRSDSERDRLIRQAVVNAKAVQAIQEAGEKPVAKRASVVETTLALLEKACQEMSTCKYSAENREVAWETVQLFNRAVIKVVNSAEKDDDIVLDACEPKDLILQFLVDIHERHHRYRSYVKSICNRLYSDDFSAWKEAIENDATVNAMVQDLVCDKKAEGGDDMKATTSGSAAVPASALETVKRAKVADSRGSIGVLLVFVKSAHNLPNVDTRGSLTDAFVRVSLSGGRIQRTRTIDDDLNPKWNFPMDFEVPSLESSIKFEVFHEDPKKEQLIGQVGLRASALPKVMARSFAEADVMRLALQGPSNAFIEIKLAFEPAPSLLDESAIKECDGTVGSFIGDKAERHGKYVTWVSVDPRKEGQPVPYPSEIATALEFALSSGDDKVDISVAIPGASVVLNCYPFRQMTKTGSRYVARCEMAERGDSISVYVACNSKKEWRLEDSSTPGASKRTETIDADKVIDSMANAAAQEAKVAQAEAEKRRAEGISSSVSMSSSKSGSFAKSGGGYPRLSDPHASKGAGKDKFHAKPGGKSECTLQ